MSVASMLQGPEYGDPEESHAKRKVLQQLPAELDLELLYPFRGVWHLTVKGALPQLLEQLAPTHARMTMERGVWTSQAEDRPVDWEQRVLPLWADKQGVHWHHVLDDGMPARVLAQGVQLPVLPGYEPVDTPHKTVLMRQLRPLEFETSPMERETRAWDDFFTQEHYRANQRYLASCFKALSSRNIELSTDMLPVPAASMMEIAGERLVILRASGSPAPETWPEGTPLFALQRLGGFTQAFTNEEARRLVEFSNSRRCDLKAQEQAAVEEGMKLVKEAIAGFEKEFLGSVASLVEAGPIQRWAQQETRLPVKLWISEIPGRSLSNPEMELRLELWGHHDTTRMKRPMGAYEPEGFDFQNPSFYEYVDNEGAWPGQAPRPSRSMRP